MPTRQPKIHQSPADSLDMQNLKKRQLRDQIGESNPKSMIDLPESMRKMKEIVSSQLKEEAERDGMLWTPTKSRYFGAGFMAEQGVLSTCLHHAIVSCVAALQLYNLACLGVYLCVCVGVCVCVCVSLCTCVCSNLGEWGGGWAICQAIWVCRVSALPASGKVNMSETHTQTHTCTASQDSSVDDTFDKSSLTPEEVRRGEIARG